jgi:hypothetical protein
LKRTCGTRNFFKHFLTLRSIDRSIKSIIVCSRAILKKFLDLNLAKPVRTPLIGPARVP